MPSILVCDQWEPTNGSEAPDARSARFASDTVVTSQKQKWVDPCRPLSQSCGIPREPGDEFSMRDPGARLLSTANST
jgi:hypothetical protein